VNALADPRRRAILRLVRDVERPLGEIAAAGVDPRILGRRARGPDRRRRASTLTLLLLKHIGTETGEIACLKGLQGARRYPF
jgi:DNA-binding transcriptional ArsR family regulator